MVKSITKGCQKLPIVILVDAMRIKTVEYFYKRNIEGDTFHAEDITRVRGKSK